ncbi:hypothetical protein ABZ540_28595 [Nocardia xishanensis]|uniref:hypothetical protein n=1 Tax=Nocardia xishanensis TaxID=238964 RepID=UPI0033DC967B
MGRRGALRGGPFSLSPGQTAAGSRRAAALVPEVGVAIALRQQLGVRAAFHDATAVDEQDLVRVRDGGQGPSRDADPYLQCSVEQCRVRRRARQTLVEARRMVLDERAEP